MAKAKKSEPAIEIKNITKEFILPQYQNDSLKQLIVHGFKRNKKTRRTVLNDISFTINKGDFFGIVGRNGSGKSTLLKLICGIYTPTSGEIVTHGKITPFIELGVGFNPELSGRDNVYLNGALLGFSRKEMREMYDDIVEFAELEKFMDLKLKNYSSGMQVRLAFSIAIRAKSDILVLDEVLAVGDEAFQRKCNDYFEEIKEDKNTTVVLVTHSMGAVRRYCDRAVMIEDGVLKISGDPGDVANYYSLKNLTEGSNSDDELSPDIARFEAELLSKKKINQDEKVKIRYRVETKKDARINIVMDLCNMDDRYYIYCYGSPKKIVRAGKEEIFEVEFDISHLNNMNIRVNSALFLDGEMKATISESNSPKFMINRTDYENKKKPQAGTIFKDGKNARWTK